MDTSLRIEQKNLMAILASCLPICSKRTTLDATATIFFQIRHRELVVKCTDLEVALQMSHPLEDAQVDEPVSVLVPCKRFHDVVKELEGQLSIRVAGHNLILSSPQGSISLHTADAANFPPFPERIENLMEIPSERLLNLLRSVAFVIPSHHSNAALTGILCEIDSTGFAMTATDGHCLAHSKNRDLRLNEARSWLIPRRSVIELQKIIEVMREKTVFLGVCGKQLVISGESFNFFTKLLNGTFPAYAQVLDHSEFAPARIARVPLLKTIRRAATLLSGQFIAARFAFDQRSVAVSLTNKDVGAMQEELPLEGFAGAACEVRFYAPYLLQGLNTFDEETLAVHIHSAHRPIIFNVTRDEGIVSQVYLVMPVAPQNAGG